MKQASLACSHREHLGGQGWGQSWQAASSSTGQWRGSKETQESCAFRSNDKKRSQEGWARSWIALFLLTYLILIIEVASGGGEVRKSRRRSIGHEFASGELKAKPKPDVEIPLSLPHKGHKITKEPFGIIYWSHDRTYLKTNDTYLLRSFAWILPTGKAACITKDFRRFLWSWSSSITYGTQLREIDNIS